MSEDFILNIKGSEVKNSRKKNRQEVLDHAFSYWRNRGFPYCEFDAVKFEQTYEHLSRTSYREVISNSRLISNPLGVSFANFFHPQIWHTKVKNAYTPFERFVDDRALMKILIQAFMMWPHRKVFNATNLRNAIRIYSKTRCPANFRPTASKAIIELLSRPGDRILDFSAGFGGRLLGCMSLERTYVGIDPSIHQVEGLKRMVAYCSENFDIKSSVKIVRSCAEDYMPRLKSANFSLIFTSPPYFNHERYDNDADQAHVRYPEYEIWKEQFLDTVIKESRRLLKRDGYFVINLKNVDSLRLADDFYKTAKQHFKFCRKLHMQIVKRPYRAESTSGEPIFIFQK